MQNNNSCKNPALCKILLIDDNLKDAEVTKHWLEKHAEVAHVINVTDAIKKIKAEPWTLIIIDAAHTGLKGIEGIQQINSLAPWTPVLIITTHQNVEYTVNILQNHTDAILFKPLDKTAFLNLVFKLAQDSEHRRKNEQKIVLAIGAHPDDVEIGAGGCLAYHHSRGDLINILTLTTGEFGGNRAKRKKEALAASKKLNAQLYMGDLTDTHVTEGTDTIHFIDEIIKTIKPTHVYTHSLHDNHQDHRNAHLASIVSCRHIANLYCYQSPSSTIDFKPNLFVEISKFIDLKINVLATYKTQLKTHPYLQPDMILAVARYWGRYINYGLAEPMEVIRQEYL